MDRVIETKKYLVSEDKYSGQVVIICDTIERLIPFEEGVYTTSLAEVQTLFRVRAYYNYQNGESRTNLIFCEQTTSKDRANEYFKQAVILTR